MNNTSMYYIVLNLFKSTNSATEALKFKIM